MKVFECDINDLDLESIITLHGVSRDEVTLKITSAEELSKLNPDIYVGDLRELDFIKYYLNGVEIYYLCSGNFFGDSEWADGCRLNEWDMHVTSSWDLFDDETKNEYRNDYEKALPAFNKIRAVRKLISESKRITKQ